MRKSLRDITILLAIILITGYLLINYVDIDYIFSDFTVNCLIFAFISMSTLIIFFIGQREEAINQMLYTLAAITSKLLLEIAFAVIWFIFIKKTELKFVLLFFALYLAFTLFTVVIIMKTLLFTSC